MRIETADIEALSVEKLLVGDSKELSDVGEILTLTAREAVVFSLIVCQGPLSREALYGGLSNLGLSPFYSQKDFARILAKLELEFLVKRAEAQPIEGGIAGPRTSDRFVYLIAQSPIARAVAERTPRVDHKEGLADLAVHVQREAQSDIVQLKERVEKEVAEQVLTLLQREESVAPAALEKIRILLQNDGNRGDERGDQEGR